MASDSITASASTSGAVSLPKTGQTTVYSTDDDGQLQRGVAWPSPRFTVDGTGNCVTDNLTGLMWVKGPDSTKRTWQEALDYANGLTLCGYSDWRLPNVNELESLINAEQSDNATWLNNQGFSNVQSSNWYWSSTTPASQTSAACVGMWSGRESAYYKTDSYYVWPVRAGQGEYSATVDLPETGQTTCYDSSGNVISCTGTGQDGDIKAGVTWPSPRFTVDGTGNCVTDNLTGLMWTKDANLPAGKKTWQQALDYANGLTLCGYSDWRLPNKKELRSLIDYSRYSPALSSGHPFTNVQSDDYWLSTTSAIDTSRAWVVVMSSGGVDGSPKDSGRYVWPARAGTP